MEKLKTDLAAYNNSWYRPGPAFKRACWYLVSAVFFKTSFFPVSSFKVLLLRLFGAKVGKGVIIKPCVIIKYPWFLRLGDNSWIGENAWIDNLGMIFIGNNVCLSQGSMLLSGNHDYTQPTFDLAVKEIVLEDGVWIGAKSIVCGGVVCKDHSVLAAGSVANKNMEPYSIYQGNPAIKKREREMS
ncbi:MAG: WcaF family extracellular polysaccharide biosynthesis acetyltransferase [Bacteroidota bacterium]|nr:WcaF family extracellular polysaccharide biosynthesis acetyltransferase [Bacteroidota bacterium]